MELKKNYDKVMDLKNMSGREPKQEKKINEQFIRGTKLCFDKVEDMNT